jgi:hypothetical protein
LRYPRSAIQELSTCEGPGEKESAGPEILVGQLARSPDFQETVPEQDAFVWHHMAQKKGVWNFEALKTPAFIDAGEFQTPFFGQSPVTANLQ